MLYIHSQTIVNLMAAVKFRILVFYVHIVSRFIKTIHIVLNAAP